MNLPRRINISLVVIKTYGVGTYYWMLMANILRLPAAIVAVSAKWTVRRRLERYSKATDKFKQRTNSILPELRIFDRLPEDRKTQVLGMRSALLEESKRLQTCVSALKVYRPPAMALLLPTIAYIQARLNRRRRKIDSFRRVIDRIDSDTFYCDLILWLVISSAHDDELLGDLNEEYSLRYSQDGEINARHWYRAQVARTLKDSLWEKIERLAAIGALIDLLDRWFRK